MNTKFLTLARKNFCNDWAPIHVQRHNMRQWARSLRLLGDKWLLAAPLNHTSTK
jgi:hypothetical protein